MPPDEEQKEVRKKPKSKKMMFILPLLVILLGAGGAGAYFKFFKGPAGKTDKAEHGKYDIYEMNTFLVNLADPGGKRYLKASIKLKVSSAAVAKECQLNDYEIRDRVLTLLSSKETDEVMSPDDKAVLKKQIMDTVNRALHKGRVLDVYFTDFLIQ